MDETLERLAALIADVPLGTAEEPKLPTERKMASVLDINRGTLRERLAALEILGLIRRKQGSGTYLGMPHPTFIRLYFEMAVKLGYVEVDQLQQARELIEREVAGLAATHASDKDVDTLERCVKRMLDSENAEDGDQADYEFHMTMVQASGNPVMVLMMEGLSSVLRQLLQLRRRGVWADPGRIDRMNAIHLPILEAVRDHDPERAVAAMDEHFRIWNEMVREVDGPKGHAERAS